MTLLVDVGNSAIKWTPLTADSTLHAADRQLHRGVDDIAERLVDQWRSSVKPGTIVIACNVAGPAVVAAVEHAARTLQLEPVRWMAAQSRFDGAVALENGYRNPAQLGADRWHCMLGACAAVSAQQMSSSFIVVNAGTATTVDCVEASDDSIKEARWTATFIGGVIAPGVRLMLESLALQTAGLPSADIDEIPAADFPDNTDGAIVTGVLEAQAGLIDRIWRRFAARLKTEPRLIITGGHAEALLTRLPVAPDIEHNLVLRGLALRAQSDAHAD